MNGPKNREAYIPKIGYKITPLILTGEINMKYCTNFDKGAFVLNPNIGLYLWPLVKAEVFLTYGYDYVLINKTNIIFNGHKVKLTWNLFMYNRKYQKKYLLF